MIQHKSNWKGRKNDQKAILRPAKIFNIIHMTRGNKGTADTWLSELKTWATEAGSGEVKWPVLQWC